MPYLIDSDWVIDHLEGIPNAVALLARLATDGNTISIVTYMEVYQGIVRSPNPIEAEERLNRFVAGATVLPFSMPVARRCARLRESLRQQGKRVNPRSLDLIIAATAIEHDLTLVTRNTDDYRDIPGLTLYR